MRWRRRGCLSIVGGRGGGREGELLDLGEDCVHLRLVRGRNLALVSR